MKNVFVQYERRRLTLRLFSLAPLWNELISKMETNAWGVFGAKKDKKRAHGRSPD
jgi:hypothetical protein